MDLHGKSLFYALIAILVFFLVIDFVSVFFVRRGFDVKYYNTEISVDYTGNVTIKTVSGLVFSSESRKRDYLKAYGENSRETFEKYFSQISKDIGKSITVVDVKSELKELGEVLEITESVLLTGLVSVDGPRYKLSMGKVRLADVGNSSLSVSLPDGAVAESIEPTPTKVLGNVIIWAKEDIRYFPEVTFRRGD